MLPGIAGRRRVDARAASPNRPSEPPRPTVIEGTFKRLDDDGDDRNLSPLVASDIVAAGAAC